MQKIIELYQKADEIERVFEILPSEAMEGFQFECIHDKPKYIKWRQAIIYRLETLNRKYQNATLEETLCYIKNNCIQCEDKESFYNIKGQLELIIESKDEILGNQNNVEKKKVKKIFISHSTIDKEYVGKIVELLEDIGLDNESIFCSSYPGYDIPIDVDIYEYLKKQFLEYDIHVIFVLSDSYYQSPASLNEMGATWILQKKYSSILLPKFEFRNMRGVINPNKIALKLDSTLDDVKNKLRQVRDMIIDEFQLRNMAESKWERNRDSFIEQIKKICNEDVVSKDVERVLAFMLEDSYAQIVISETLNGTSIDNSKGILVENNPQEVEKWLAVIRIMEEQNYIRAKNQDKTVFTIADKGYLFLKEINE